MPADSLGKDYLNSAANFHSYPLVWMHVLLVGLWDSSILDFLDHSTQI